MKKTPIFVVVALAILGTLSAPASAQTKQRSMFDTQEACETALVSKDFAFYVPVNVRDKGKNTIDNINIFPVKLEADQCRFQKTIKGWKYVVQAGNTLMRARKDASGELIIFARNDCGNADKTANLPEPIPAEAEAEKVVEPPAVVAPATAAPIKVEPVRLDIRVKYDTPPSPLPPAVVVNHDHRWYCARHPVVCTIGGLVIVGGGFALSGGGGSKSGTPPGGNTGPAF